MSRNAFHTLFKEWKVTDAFRFRGNCLICQPLQLLLVIPNNETEIHMIFTGGSHSDFCSLTLQQRGTCSSLHTWGHTHWQHALWSLCFNLPHCVSWVCVRREERWTTMLRWHLRVVWMQSLPRDLTVLFSCFITSVERRPLSTPFQYYSLFCLKLSLQCHETHLQLAATNRNIICCFRLWLQFSRFYLRDDKESRDNHCQRFVLEAKCFYR